MQQSERHHFKTQFAVPSLSPGFSLSSHRSYLFWGENRKETTKVVVVVVVQCFCLKLLLFTKLSTSCVCEVFLPTLGYFR